MRIFEIFNSISGEVGEIPQGGLTTFIRMAGCNLHCSYCDTEKAQSVKSGKNMSIDEIMTVVEGIGCRNVLITGGEPLHQLSEFIQLVTKLDEKEYFIQVETNGSFLPPFGAPVDCWVMDYKLHSSGMGGRMNAPSSIITTGYGGEKRGRIWYKFVCGNKKELDDAIDMIKKLQGVGFRFAIGAIHSKFEPSKIVKELQKERLWGVVVNMQIHKMIGVD